MFESKFITHAINRSAENRLDRRRFLKAAGLTGAGIGAASLLGAPDALAADSGAPSDAAILNFALNLEYLEAQFYSIATSGAGLPTNILGGTGTQGGVTGGRAVSFSDPKIKAFATEIAKDEMEHVRFFRTALGNAAVAQPAINLDASFKAAAKAAGLGDNFDPYASDQAFLLAAFVFEDVGVTAFKGAAPLISNKTYLGAAAGVLAVEAYHAGLIRTTLYGMGMDAQSASNAISKARGSLDRAHRRERHRLRPHPGPRPEHRLPQPGHRHLGRVLPERGQRHPQPERRLGQQRHRLGGHPGRWRGNRCRRYLRRPGHRAAGRRRRGRRWRGRRGRGLPTQPQNSRRRRARGRRQRQLGQPGIHP